jgi:3-dehydroquinate synthase
MAHRIDVKTPEGSYAIEIESGAVLRDASMVHAQPANTARDAVVTNTTLEPLYGFYARSVGLSPLITIPDGESYKTLETVTRMYDAFIAAQLDRSATIYALGGGVVGDIVGFAAATYLRGVKFVQIPTTLLAMVDSSVGGKVGVNLPQGKNLVGAFKQPERVIIDPLVLKSLNHRQWSCGMAEVIKHGLLADEALLDPALWTLERMEELIARAVQVKVDVVQADPYEQNIRAHLNLGHTFAHAIERVTHYQWLHGEAVGVGLIAAARLSARLGLCDEALVQLVERTVALADLPTRLGDLDPEALWAAMNTDKKRISGKSRFVLLKGMNAPTIVENVAARDVLNVLESLQR